MAVAAGNQTGTLAWVKAIQQENEIQDCVSCSDLGLLLQPCQGQNKRPQHWDTPGPGDSRSLCQLTPACVRPLSPTAAHCSVLHTRGREGEFYLHGAVASTGLLLKGCQAPSEDLLLHHTQQLELFPELQALRSSFTCPYKLGETGSFS